MGAAPVHTDQLRSACIDYVMARREEIDPLGKGFLSTQTPGGLEISITPGWMSMVGTFETPFGDEELQVEYTYGDPNSPHVQRAVWDKPRSQRVETVKRSEHYRVATQLMELLEFEVVDA